MRLSASDNGMFSDNSAQTMGTSFSLTKQSGNPVKYKLVRVAGDGRLVPATDEEIIEVEDLLENDETDMHIVTHTGQTVEDISDDRLPSRLPLLESSEATNLGLSQSDNTEASPDKLASQLEYTVEMLQRVEEEVRLCMAHEPQMLSACSDANIQCSNESNKLFSSDVKVQSETLLQDLTQDQNGCGSNQQMKAEPCLNVVGSPQEAVFSTSAQKPDFSTVRGDICLDNLSIKALHETFRATFGRETTVKDKLWLKRRIAMGLLNSCYVSTTCLTIKDNKLIGGQKENFNCLNDDFSKDVVDEIRVDDSNKEAASGPSDQIDGFASASGDSSMDNFGNHECGGEDFASEHRAEKRQRKPTRRYIEELSDTDDRQRSGKSMNPSKNQRLSPKSQIKTIRAVSSGGRLVITRVVYLAGSRMQVPFVFQTRRGRPRENIMALVDIQPGWLEEKATPAGNSQRLSPSQLNGDNVNGGLIIKSAFEHGQKESKNEHSNSVPTVLDRDMEPEQVELSGNSSDENHVGMPTFNSALRRKHHRAWSLSEVIKLVEGVAKYGAGKWSEIKRLSFASHSYRTSVDLKDKWRNLLKASFSQTPSKRMGSMRKHGSTPIPTPILLRVRELAEKQSQVPAVSKAKDKRTGFL
ncbi:PREDICTED: uncharacterized protein LOC104808052 isoform X1 [Tarenaya hassleriana]|uniref:uncharacterized protein LOC104808052 isoform X1 n=1 Tax=Tarenaya hassleriana TaxID=28532 RepID=UPI00053C7204|nr:PREDICTED: uncharacterized protein LOC104808052 isoform X1 [Tarenaya hassleriana]